MIELITIARIVIYVTFGLIGYNLGREYTKRGSFKEAFRNFFVSEEEDE